MNQSRHVAGRDRHEAGFTLVEAVVTIVAFSFILLMAFGLFTRLGQVAVGNEQVGRSQAGARVAIDEIERALRAAGAEVDIARGQRVFVWADPYQVAFNANITPGNDPNGTLAPGALNVASANAGVPTDGGAFYFPAASFATGAETIVFSLDSNRDGAVDAADKVDDPEERSDNPNDYVLYRSVHGSNAGRNVVELSPIAVVRGPEPAEPGDFVPPLFSYWIDQDDDRTTPPVLVGDANGDGAVSAAEAAQLAPLPPRDLARIERISVSVTSETATRRAEVRENAGFERVNLSTEVKVRQVPRSSATIWGVAFKDLDGDGVQDPNDLPMGGVIVQSSTGMQTKTAANGQFVMAVSPGAVTITQIEPTGYVATTSNVRAVDAYPGSYTRVDFGNQPSSGLGLVRGQVYEDVDGDGRIDDDERGIANVKIFADTGEYTFTQANGSYTLDVQLGVRTISQVDSTGYISTTPNAVDVEVTADGDHVVNFGDQRAEDTGTVEGYVFDDANRNAMRDAGEAGVPGARIVVGTMSTESDNDGFFSLTVPAGTYSVFEEDPPGYTSTTPNILTGIRVVTDQVVTVFFGDLVREDLDFEVIELADTEKALSLAAGDLREDNRGDPDLILGTRYSGGTNNLLVWSNERLNSRTPNSAIFNATPSFTRSNPADVVSLIAADLDRDRDVDLITGLATSNVADFNVWITNAGVLPNSATASYDTDNGAIVWDLQRIDINGDGIEDVLAAVDETGRTSGHAEIWWGRSGGRFESSSSSFFRSMAPPHLGPLNSVTSAQAGDLNGDGAVDVVVASVDSPYVSSVHVFLQETAGSFFTWTGWQSFEVQGAITQLRLIDLVEDDRGDMDIVVASAMSEISGHIEVWHQDETMRFGLVNEAGRSMNDLMPTGGAPLSLIVTHLDNDLFPDTVVGVRRNNAFEGTVEYALGFGHLLSEPIQLTDFSIGAVLTMTESDFNLDGVNDFAVGTQNSSTRGKIFVFFRR